MSLINNKFKVYVFSLLFYSIPLLAQDEYFSCNTIKGIAILSVENNRLIYRMVGDKGKF